MTSAFKKLLCILLALGVAVGCFAGCTKSKTPNSTPSAAGKTTSGSTEPADDSPQDNEPQDDTDDPEPPDDDSADIPNLPDIDNPNDPAWPDDPTDPDEIVHPGQDDPGTVDPEDPEDPEDPDDPEPEDDVITYTSPFAAVGPAVSGQNRTIKVDNNRVVYKNFIGLGANHAALYTSEYCQKKYGIKSPYFDLEAKRWNTASMSLVRVWFQYDYFFTNVETDYKNVPVSENRDYKNYLNGVFDFESDSMKALVDYFKEWKKSDTKVLLDLGWYHGARIQSWFGIQNTASDLAAAPYDIDACCKATVALLKYLRNDLGLTNVQYISYANEINAYDSGREFTVIGDQYTYYAKLMKEMKRQINSEPTLKGKIACCGAEIASNYDPLAWFGKNCKDIFDHNNFHVYFTEVNMQRYGDKYEDFVWWQYLKMNDCANGNVLHTEFSAAAFECTGGNIWKNWENSYAGVFIAAANTGTKGLLSWNFSTMYMGDPLYYEIGGDQDTSAFKSPKSIDDVDLVYGKSNIFGLLGQYASHGMDVLYCERTGDDLRVTTLRDSDGNYTLVVEANDAKAQRHVEIDFSKAVNKTFYRFTYNRASKVDANFTIPACNKTFNNIGTTLYDTLEKDYGVYIYTTKKPIKQINLSVVGKTVQPGDKVNLGATMVDCDAGDKILYKVNKATADKGTVSGNGVYTVPSNAKSGDTVSVKAYLESDSNVYAICLIEVK